MRSALRDVSSSRLNAEHGGAGKRPKMRKSMAGPSNLPRYSLGGALASSRKSMMPALDHRRQSVAASRRQSTVSIASRRQSTVSSRGGGGGMSLKSDPRPLSDKGFRSQCIETLIRFLSEHAYDQAITPKILHRPTGKDFEHIASFLFRLLDPSRRNGKSFADDVTVTLKGLRYPFNISKTSLAAVGSPHTWPALLASLVWLVELLEYDEVTGLSADEPGDGEAAAVAMAADDDIGRAFFTYLRKAYQCFLSGDDARYEELDSKLTAQFQQRDGAIADELRGLEAARTELEQRLEAESSSLSLIPDLQQRQRDFESDKGKWSKLISQYEENKDILVRKVRKHEAESRAMEQELAQAQRSKERVQQTLDEQELSPADAERMQHERRTVEADVNRALEQRDETNQQLLAASDALASTGRAAEELVVAYNDAAQRLRLQGGNIKLRLDLGSAGGSEADSGGDGKGDGVPALVGQESGAAADAGKIKAALQNLHDMSLEKTHHIRTSNMELQAAAEEKQDEQDVLGGVIKAVEQRLEHAERRFQEDKAEMEVGLAQRANDTESVEEEIHRLETEAAAMQPPRQEAAAKLADLRERLVANAARNEVALTKVDGDLHDAIETYCAFKEKVDGSLSALHATLAAKLDVAKQHRADTQATLSAAGDDGGSAVRDVVA